MNKSASLCLLVAIAIALPFGASQAASFRFSEKDVEEITGEVQKPDVTIVISRENLNKAYELDLEKSFVDGSSNLSITLRSSRGPSRDVILTNR